MLFIYRMRMIFRSIFSYMFLWCIFFFIYTLRKEIMRFLCAFVSCRFSSKWPWTQLLLFFSTVIFVCVCLANNNKKINALHYTLKQRSQQQQWVMMMMVMLKVQKIHLNFYFFFVEYNKNIERELVFFLFAMDFFNLHII